ncbi:ubinuclein-1 isoform X2 [Corythoichthys intestinalis]|uniref:ubinuclein-1 isoform X2 n=1 Tax=Corythoichthys intestinalis TaxID=161448 RepID=UPI0025A68F08|nr:ubinuclein-1 isoform X2 [Corythoichthys intestinalis]
MLYSQCNANCYLCFTQISKKDEVQTSPKSEAKDKRENELMADIVRKMEEKYAVKKKQDRLQDLIDMGYGYDDEDSFIDNSEAYDEFVPSSLTTEYGGFYINTGLLQFRQTSENELDNDRPENSEKPKLKEGQKPPKKRSRKAQQDKDDVDIKPRADDHLTNKKKKKTAGTLSVTSMLKKFRREKELERQKMERAHQHVTPPGPADAGGGGSGLADPLLSLIGSTNEQALLQAASTVEFDIDLDCLLGVGDDIPSPQSLMEATLPILSETDHQLPSEVSTDAAKPPSRDVTQPQKAHSESRESLQCVTFPEGLPPTLEDSIKCLMLAAKTSEGESKLKFFTPEINSLLLDIEYQCREHGGQLRTRVYTYLSSFLPCSKETLLKRVKKLKLAESLSNMEDPMWKLNEAIQRAMTEQIALFNQKCQEYEHAKTLQIMEDGSEVKCGGQGNAVEEKVTKRGAGPKKLFKWNERIREALHHVLREKISVFQSRNKDNQHLDNYLKILLIKDFKPLWPKGWMQTRVLLDESRRLLGLQPTNPRRSRPKKKQLSIVAPSVLDQNTKSLPVNVGLPHEADSAKEGSSASYVTTEGNEVIILDSDSSQVLDELDPRVPTPPASAVAKYKSSPHNWRSSSSVSPQGPQCSRPVSQGAAKTAARLNWFGNDVGF